MVYKRQALYKKYLLSLKIGISFNEIFFYKRVTVYSKHVKKLALKNVGKYRTNITKKHNYHSFKKDKSQIIQGYIISKLA